MPRSKIQYKHSVVSLPSWPLLLLPWSSSQTSRSTTTSFFKPLEAHSHRFNSWTSYRYISLYSQHKDRSTCQNCHSTDYSSRDIHSIQHQPVESHSCYYKFLKSSKSNWINRSNFLLLFIDSKFSEGDVYSLSAIFAWIIIFHHSSFNSIDFHIRCVHQLQFSFVLSCVSMFICAVLVYFYLYS